MSHLIILLSMSDLWEIIDVWKKCFKWSRLILLLALPLVHILAIWSHLTRFSEWNPISGDNFLRTQEAEVRLRFGMTSVWNDKSSEWQGFGMTSVWNDKCSEWQVFEMTNVRNDNVRTDICSEWQWFCYTNISWENFLLQSISKYF